jgi:pimeloyl-ACP methyl ester carboxylesterase
MSLPTRALSFATLAILVLAGCGSPSGSRSPTAGYTAFEPTSCPFPVAQGAFTPSHIRCGYLVVPENRQAETGKTVKLAVAVFKSPSRNPAPDPLIYLEGGPGSPLVDAEGPSIVASGMPDYVGNRDLILVDQRGAGLSQPSLACETGDSWQNCRMRLARERIDLSAYNTVESAADIAALGPALGYKKVDLFGNSYGTTLALQVMRDHPKGIRAVVMDGITGPTFNTYDGYNAYLWYGLRQIFKDCAASPACSSNHPHLQQTFVHLLARLQAHPATVAGYSPKLDRTVSATMTGLGLWVTMREIVADPTGPPLVPSIIDNFAAGDYTIAVQFVGNTLSDNSATSEGMHYAMDCSGEPSASSTTIVAHSRMVPAPIRSAAIANITGYLEICNTWRVPKIPAINHTYFRSSIPTLLLPGRYDPKTPSFLARALAPKLGHAYLVPIPTLSHMVVGYDWCPDSIASAFLARPNQKPDSSCTAEMSMVWP